jgi:hypothetical protein
MNASQECEDLWATYQTRYGRSMAVCAKYGYAAIEWIVRSYQFMIQMIEFNITNQVNFSYWQDQTGTKKPPRQ